MLVVVGTITKKTGCFQEGAVVGVKCYHPLPACLPACLPILPRKWKRDQP